MSNLNYWFQHDKTTGTVYPYLQVDSPTTSSQVEVVGPYPYDTASTEVVMAYNYPQRFTVQSGALVEQPYFSVSTAESTTNSSQFTITATLNNPTATPPTTATFNICGGTITAPITNGVATATVQLDQTVEGFQVTASVSASGCVSGTTSFGGNSNPSVGLQLYQPASGTPIVCPAGSGSKGYMMNYYGLSIASMQRLIADAGTITSVLADAVFNLIIPTLQNQTYTPLSPSQNQANAISDVKNNVLANLYTTLENAYPSGGARQLQWQDYVTDQANTYKSFEAYMNALQTYPNLA